MNAVIGYNIPHNQPLCNRPYVVCYTAQNTMMSIDHDIREGVQKGIRFSEKMLKYLASPEKPFY